MQKYKKNEGHYKALHQERDSQKPGKDRLFVFMLYLNDVDGDRIYEITFTNLVASEIIQFKFRKQQYKAFCFGSSGYKYFMFFVFEDSL